jgi:hypothetical protein
MGSVVIKNFEALVWWVRDKIRRGQDIIANEFTADAMAKALEDVVAFKTALELKDTVELVKFKGTENWTDAKESFDNKLEATFGANDAPLSYIARDEVPDDYEYADDQERLKYEIQHQGQAYIIDNRRVFRMLKEWLTGTDGWTYIREFDRMQDGRRALNALKAHYDGEGESLKRIAIAKKQIEELYYKSEQALSFQQYTTKLKEALLELDKDEDERLTGKQKVEILLKGMSQHSDTRVQSLVLMARREHPRDFMACANYIGQEITRLFPGIAEKKQRRRIGKTGTKGGGRGGGRGGRGNGGRGRGGGRGGRGGGRRNGSDQQPVGTGTIIQQNGKTSLNGVDITDVQRRFTSDEMRKFASDWPKVQELRRAKRTIEAVYGGTTPTRQELTGSQEPEPADEQQEPTTGNRGGRNGTAFGRGR